MEEALPTFVEVEGAVLRNPFDGQPIGTRLGVAVEDPQGLRFYASFAAAPDQATTLQFCGYSTRNVPWAIPSAACPSAPDLAVLPFSFLVPTARHGGGVLRLPGRQ